MIDSKKRNNALRISGILKDKVFTGPKSICFDLINQCNLSCNYCVEKHTLNAGNKKTQTIEKINFDVFAGAIDDCYDLGVEQITLTGGGEPFLHPDISKMIAYIKQRNIDISFNTNGTFSKNFRKYLKNICWLHINVSATNYKDYQKFQGGSKRMFNNLISNIKFITSHRINARHPSVNIVYVLTKDNFLKMDEAITWAQEIGADSIRFKWAVAPEKNDEITIAINSLKKLKEVIKRIFRRRNNIKIKTNIMEICQSLLSVDSYNNHERLDICGLSNKSLYFQDNFKKDFSCYVGWFRTYILNSGDVWLCFGRATAPAGNIYRKSFKEIWYSKEAHQVRLDMKYNYRMQDQHWKRCIRCCDLRFNTDIKNIIINKSIYNKTISGNKILLKRDLHIRN